MPPKKRKSKKAGRNLYRVGGAVAMHVLLLSSLVATLAPLALTQTSVGTANDHERRLIYDLFKNYNKLIRPAQVMNETIHVGFQEAMVQVISISERDQLMKTNVWLRFDWTDFQLQWDPADYGGVNVLRIPMEDVWTPEIVLLNNADGVFDISFPCKVLVYPSGYVLWVPCSIFQSSCTIDVLYFPFDEQTCEMIFGSWTYNSKQVSMSWYDAATFDCEGNKLCFADVYNYVRSGAWDLIAAPARVNTRDSGTTDISYFYVIRRKTTYYIINLVIPCVIISSLSIFVFYLPPDEGEKLGLTMAVLLGLMVFLLLVSAILPTTSDAVPLLSKYLLFTFVMNVLTVMYTVVVINYNLRTPTADVMPYWMKLLFLRWIPKIIRFKRPPDPTPGSRKDGGRFEDLVDTKSLGESMTKGSFSGTPVKKQSTGDLGIWADLGSPGRNWADFYIEKDDNGSAGSNSFLRLRNASITGSYREDVMKVSTSGAIAYPKEFLDAGENVRYIADNLMDSDNFDNIIEDWKYIALVFDRLLLLIFVTITLFGTTVLLLNQPFIMDAIDQAKVIEDWVETHQRNMKNSDFISSVTGFENDLEPGLSDETSIWF